MQAFWKDACDEGGLAWDDTNNNRAFMGGEIGGQPNGASIYIAAKRGQDKIKDDKGEPMVRDIQHARLPAGPGGSWSYHTAFAHGIMKYTKNAAGQGLPEVVPWQPGPTGAGSRWPRASRSGHQAVGAAPLWNTIDEPMKGFKTAADNSRVIGFAGRRRPRPPRCTAST